ncbi:MAG TPA: hypothetical protein VMT20_30310 [Terriglobia bacterium]|nr:hypothetical protein [Terriglobia bacterium]
MAAARSLLAFRWLLGLRRSLTQHQSSGISLTAATPVADPPIPAVPAAPDCGVPWHVKRLMRKLSMLGAAVPFFFLLTGTLALARPINQEMRSLKRAHKQQWKSLKEQERAEKDALERHPQTPESRRRFKHDMNEQRRLVKQVQKSEIRGLKESQHASKHETSRAKHTEAQARRETP